MLKIRLQRVGRRHEPAFRLVLTDAENSTKSGRFKEVLGSYDPRKTRDELKAERIKYWLSQGVTPTVTVNNLLITHNIISGVKMNASSVSKTAQKAQKEAKVAEPVKEEKEETPAPESATITEEAEAPAEAEIVEDKPTESAE